MVLKHRGLTQAKRTKKFRFQQFWFKQKNSHGKVTRTSLGERAFPNTQMPPLCTTLGIKMYENNFIVTPIDRNKGNQPESSTCYVGDMNISHSLVSVI